MSFSSQVREELVKQYANAKHCQIAELAAIINCVGDYGIDDNDKCIVGFQTDNQNLIEKGFSLLKKAYHLENKIDKKIEVEKSILDKFSTTDQIVDPLIIKSSCCQRAFLRGIFLCMGSMSDPEKSYHLEFVCGTKEKAEQVVEVLSNFRVEAKIVLRKKYFVVYIKEGAAIADLLNIMEARLSLLEFENLRIVREVRNSVNRRVNCETANIGKTVIAASKQIDDINKIKKYQGLSRLPEALEEMAEIRLKYPDLPLKELGQKLMPPLGKSGVNHRLRKLMEIADKIEDKE